MLSVKDLTVRIPGVDAPILKKVSVAFKPGSLNAVIGPSGCGKTTLIRALVGTLPSEGEVLMDEKSLGHPSELHGRVGYVPQFCVAHRALTVEESLRDAARLHIADRNSHSARIEVVLNATGLASLRDQKVASLSGGQLRRLSLALEMVPDPVCFLCDEVTTGLDPEAENAILDLLGELSINYDRTFINVIHNLRQLHRFDWIIVVKAGEVVFQGDYAAYLQYFEIEDPESVYSVLDRTVQAKGWFIADLSGDTRERGRSPWAVPSPWVQLGVLLERRFRLFYRDRGYLFLTAAITFGFPVLVVIFALGGLPQMESLALDQSRGLFETEAARFAFTKTAMETGSLVSGLIMFQVILLTLMGSNNGAREIASERDIFEKERLRGLSPFSYALSKILFTTTLAMGQGFYMAVFVKAICGFPGPLVSQMFILAMVTLAMTSVSLGFSATFRSAERATLLSIYLVGFQLPLSGVVLALPEGLVWLTRPFISAYWGWAGYLSSFRDDRLYDAVNLVVAEGVPEPNVAVLVLLAHFAVGVALTLRGCKRISAPMQ